MQLKSIVFEKMFQSLDREVFTMIDRDHRAAILHKNEDLKEAAFKQICEIFPNRNSSPILKERPSDIAKLIAAKIEFKKVFNSLNPV